MKATKSITFWARDHRKEIMRTAGVVHHSRCRGADFHTSTIPRAAGVTTTNSRKAENRG